MRFHLALRGRGVRDRDVLRAFEVVGRAGFVDAACAGLAERDVALPIACGQTMPAPSLVARMIEALALAPGRRVLEVGAGSGHATAVLCALGATVVALERYAGLVAAARAALASLGMAAEVVHADGLAPGSAFGRFDRVLVHGALPREAAAALMADVLAPGGALVCAAGWLDPPMAVRLDAAGEVALCPARLPPLLPGRAAAL